MKKMIYILCLAVIAACVGCQRIEPNPYELTKEIRTQLKPEEQETYINMIKSLESLVATLNDTEISDKEKLKQVRSFSTKCPEEWSFDSHETPMDIAWTFFMEMSTGFTTGERYTNYADCKDAVDELGKELSDYFVQANDRRKALIVNEETFYHLYGTEKK